MHDQIFQTFLYKGNQSFTVWSGSLGITVKMAAAITDFPIMTLLYLNVAKLLLPLVKLITSIYHIY